MKSKFIRRALTGAAFVVVMVGCVLGGPISFTLLFTIVTGAAIYEFGTIVCRDGSVQMNKPISALAGMFLFLCFGYVGIEPAGLSIFVPYLLLVIYLLVSELYKKQPDPVRNWAYAMLTQVYIALGFSMLNILAYHSVGHDGMTHYNPILPLSVFIFTWVNDTGAYCIGVLFGRHRLFPRISPKKSWEGSFGGATFCVIAAIIMAHFFDFLTLPVWIGLALVVVVFATWGDLTESLLKRSLGLKDSGHILPGHGGILDRFDSTLMAVPAAVVYLYLLSL